MTVVFMRGRQRQVGWVQVSRGAHRTATGDGALVDDLAAWQLVLTEKSCFTHVTGAAVRGWWVPPLPTETPVFVAQHRSISPARRPGLIVSRHPTEPTVEVEDGLRLANAPETLLACARDLSLLDLIVLIDSALHIEACTVTELSLIAQQRRRGAPRLREALPLVDGRSESPWESMLRILHVSCGIPVEPQHVVYDRAGGFVARGDLWIVGTRTLHEYDGAHHLTRPQQRRDLQRSGRIDDVDWSRRGFTKEDVLHQGINILRAADSALGHDHDPDRIRAWHSLLRDSLQTPSGQARFRARIGSAQPTALQVTGTADHEPASLSVGSGQTQGLRPPTKCTLT